MTYKILKHRDLRDSYGSLYKDEICVTNIPELFDEFFDNNEFYEYYDGKKALRDLRDYEIVRVELKPV